CSRLDVEVSMITLRFVLLFFSLAGILCMTAGNAMQAGDKKEEPKKVELRGTIKTGIVAIGGETTGTIIDTKDGAYELAVPKELRKEVDDLNKKTAIVTGVLNTKKGLAIKLRKIVTIESVKAAPDP